MNLTLTHTEPFPFHLDDLPSNCSFFAVKLKHWDYPSIFHAEEDEFAELYVWLVDPDSDTVVDKEDADLIEAWEPIFMDDCRILNVN